MAIAPFVGRDKELQDLRLLFRKKSASLVVVQGRRRVGKSRLVMEFGKDYRYYAFSGLPPVKGATAQKQRDEFARQMGEAFGLQGIRFDDWTTLFTYLAKQVYQGKVVLLFDEISWMGSKDSDFLGKIKNAWDLHFKQNAELVLILCGSISSWIEKNILSSTGFLGRISLVIYLQELSLKESSTLLLSMGRQSSAYEQLKILCLTGGIPRYLEEVQTSMPAEENIRRLCFRKNGILYREFDDVFSDLFSKRSIFYRDIVNLLVNGSLEFNAIVKALKMSNSGHISGYLDDLIKSGFVCRDYTWHIKDAKESSLSKYRLSDNYVRFYLKYVFPNKNKIAGGHFEDKALASLPGWDTIMGLQFENLVLNNRYLIKEKLHLSQDIVIADNAFFQRKTLKAPGCQIDYLIQTKFNTLFVCEVKFYKKPIGLEIIKEMEEKLRSLTVPRGFSKFPVLIHVNGVQDSVVESGYFSEIIDFTEFLSLPE